MTTKRMVESNPRKNRLKHGRLFWVFFVTAMVLLALTVVVAFLST